MTTASYPAWGDRVRTQCGATGRYLRSGYALVVSAQDDDLFTDLVVRDVSPHPTLPVPSDRELAAAEVGWRACDTERAAAVNNYRGDTR